MTLATRPRIAALLAAAAAALVLGTLVYWSDRDPAHALLIPSVPALAGSVGFGAVGGWLPSFVHPFAFGLLTALVVGTSRRWAGVAACAGWAGVDLAFEAGQHPHLATWWHATLDRVPGGAVLTRYFSAGTFDPADIAAVVAGAVAAVAALRLATRRGSPARNT